MHVGVRVLANKIIGAVLLDNESSLDNIRQPVLFVDRSEEQGGESWILMKADTFSMNRSPTMTIGKQEFLLLPVGLVEKGENFDWVTYRRMVSDDGFDMSI